VRRARRSSHKGLKAELNVTPLVDVVLVLLIIFMVVTPFMKKGPRVDLPSARTSDSVKQNPAPVILTVTAEKALMLGGQELPRDQLEAVMQRVLQGSPTVEIYVQGDKSLRFKDVKSVLDACHKAGAKRLSLATRELKGG